MQQTQNKAHQRISNKQDDNLPTNDRKTRPAPLKTLKKANVEIISGFGRTSYWANITKKRRK